MIRLSEHFTLHEMTRSWGHPDIKNVPPPEAVEWMKKLCQQVLEPARLAWGQPIFVNSGYRSPELNSAVGGVPNSQHLLGQAADISADISLLNYDLGQLIIELNLPFDQLIFENYYKENVAGQTVHYCGWVHVSYGPRNRREVKEIKMKNSKFKMSKMIIDVKQTRAGQTHRYGDSVDEWEITTEGGCEVPEKVLLPVCFKLAHRTRIQTKAEWQQNHFDPGKYFSGYYELIRSPTGYRFRVTTPYCD